MAATIKHAFTSALSDGADDTLVQPSDWNASHTITGTVDIANGGTGSTTAAAARTALGLAIGTDVQAYDAQLADIAGLTATDNGVVIGNGTNFVVESGATLKTSLGLTIGADVQAYSANLDEYAAVNPTAAGLAILDDADNTAQRTTLGLGNSATLNTGTAAGTVATGDHNHTGVYEPANANLLETTDIGVTVQAYDAQLADVAGLAATDNGVIIGNGTNFVVESGATLKTSLGLTIGTDVQAYDVDTAKLDVAQSWTAQQTFKETKDTAYVITDGAAFEIDPVNGNIQTVTLGANRTPAATNFEANQIIMLGIDDGTAYTVTWTTVAPTWVKPGGTASAPTLATTGYTWVMLWKVGSTIYAAEAGQP